MYIDRTIIIALIFFIALFLVFLLVVPQYNEYKSLQIELGEKLSESAQKVDYYSAVDRAYYELKSKEEDLANIDSALPSESDLGKLIYFLEENAKDSNLIVSNLFLSKANPNASGIVVKNINFSMDVSGDYDALKTFMQKLENSSRIFEVLSISFRSSTAPPYKFNLQIRTYTY